VATKEQQGFQVWFWDKRVCLSHSAYKVEVKGKKKGVNDGGSELTSWEVSVSMTSACVFFIKKAMRILEQLQQLNDFVTQEWVERNPQKTLREDRKW